MFRKKDIKIENEGKKSKWSLLTDKYSTNK